MTFWALFIGLLAAESLAMPHHSFLHEVDFPSGDGPENETKPSSVQDSVTAPTTPGASSIVKREIMMGVLNITEILTNQTGDANVAANETNTASNLLTTTSSPGVSVIIVKRYVSSPEATEDAVLNATEIQSNQTGNADISVNEPTAALNLATETSSPGVSEIVKREISIQEGAEEAVLSITEIQSNQTDKANVSPNEPNTAGNLATTISSPSISGVVKREVSSQEVADEAVSNVTEIRNNQAGNANVSEDEPSTASNLVTDTSSPVVSEIVKREISIQEGAEEPLILRNDTEIQSKQTGNASVSMNEPNTSPDLNKTSSSGVSKILKRDLSEKDGQNGTDTPVNDTKTASYPLEISVVDNCNVSGQNVRGSIEEAVQDEIEIRSTAEPSASVPNTAVNLTSAPSTSGVPEIVKRDMSEVSRQKGTGIVDQNNAEVESNQTTTVQQENMSLPTEVGDVSQTSVSDDLMFKERILRSIIEGEADLKVIVSEPTLKSDKCQCPSGRCSGDVCQLLDFTSLATNLETVEPTSNVPDSTRMSRRARSLPNDTTTSTDVSTIDNSSLASTDNANNTTPTAVPVSVSQTVSPETKATLESHIQKIQTRHSRSIPDKTTSGIGDSLSHELHNPQLSATPGLKPVTLNESEIVEDTKPEDQVDAVSHSAAIARRKRDFQETLDDMLTLSDEEMAYGGETPEPASTVKLAPDAPAGFQAPNAVHLVRSSRLYMRSVLETESSGDESKSASATEEANSGSSELQSPVLTAASNTVKEATRVPEPAQVNSNGYDPTQGVSPSITALGANEGSGDTPEILATGGAASVSAQVSDASPETPMAGSEIATIGITHLRVELPGDILPNFENGGKNEENELTQTRYVRNVQDEGNVVEATVTDATSSGASQFSAKTNEQVANPDGTNMPAGTPTAGANHTENQDGNSDIGGRHRRLTTYIKPGNTTSQKTNVSSALTEADASRKLPANVTATSVKAVDAGANVTEITANSTEAASNASSVSAKEAENATVNPENVTKPNTPAAVSQPDDAEKEKSPRGANNTENQDGNSDIEGRLRRLTTNIKQGNTTSPKTNVSSALTEADASRKLPANVAATSAKVVEAGANVTEIATNSTEAAPNVSSVSAKEAENAKGNPVNMNVTKPNTPAAVSQPVVKKPQPQVVMTNEKPSITHRVFMHDDAEKEKSPRDERKMQEKQNAAREQEERRLGETTEREEQPDLGTLDIRTMGGNQLDIDPIDLHADPNNPGTRDSATVLNMDQVSSSNHLSAVPFLTLAAVLSSQLTSLLPTLAAYLSP